MDSEKLINLLLLLCKINVLGIFNMVDFFVFSLYREVLKF